MPSNTVLVSGLAVGAAQVLTWSCSSVFLPPMPTAIRASAFSFVDALNGLFYFHSHSLPNRLRGFNLQLVQPVESFRVIFLSCTAPGFQLWFCFPLHTWVVHWGLLLRLPGGLGFAPVRPGVEAVQLLGLQGLWQHQVPRGVGS